jgi:hypothetical protein
MRLYHHRIDKRHCGAPLNITLALMKRFLFSLAVVLALVASAASAQTRGTLVFVKVNESILPIPRGDKYEDPLDAALRKERLGSVTGAGSQLSAEGKVVWIAWTLS